MFITTFINPCGILCCRATERYLMVGATQHIYIYLYHANILCCVAWELKTRIIKYTHRTKFYEDKYNAIPECGHRVLLEFTQNNRKTYSLDIAHSDDMRSVCRQSEKIIV